MHHRCFIGNFDLTIGITYETHMHCLYERIAQNVDQYTTRLFLIIIQMLTRSTHEPNLSTFVPNINYFSHIAYKHLCRLYFFCQRLIVEVFYFVKYLCVHV